MDEREAGAVFRQLLRDGAAAPSVTALSRGIASVFAFAGDGWEVTVTVSDGSVQTQPSSPSAFTVRMPDAVWSDLLDPHPAPGCQSIVHLVRSGTAEVHGDEREFFRHLPLVRRIVESARPHVAARSPQRRPLRAQGSYSRVASALGVSDVYVERCGTGPQLLALATAGSDTSQWHGVMTETDLTDHYELATVDLPWHGKSSPVFGAEVGDWRLTPATYTDFIVAVSDALGLEAPVLVGASMAGAAVVHAIATHPDRFSGGVACQVGRSISRRSSALLRAADIDQSTLVPEWTYGLMNPASPAEHRTRVWWGYSSGGHGLYAADIDSYQRWDFDEIADGLTPESPRIEILSGRYDTTVPPTASRDLASRIPRAGFTEMPELGHFPHAENPAAFGGYLTEAIARVLDDRALPQNSRETASVVRTIQKETSS